MDVGCGSGVCFQGHDSGAAEIESKDGLISWLVLNRDEKPGQSGEDCLMPSKLDYT